MFISNVDYQALGATTRIEYGNGVVTTYEYDPKTLRLTHLTTYTLSPTTFLQDLTYTYDAVGNILTITDNSGRGSNQTFTYDELNRLETATGFFCNEGTEECTKNYRYDEIGNLLVKKRGTYYRFCQG